MTGGESGQFSLQIWQVGSSSTAMTANLRSESLPGRARTYQRVEQSLGLPMLVLSVLMIPVLVIPAAWPGLPSATSRDLAVADYAIWAAFALEYLLLLSLAPNRRHFARTHLLELALVLLPMLRPLRLVRSVRTAQALRAGRCLREPRRAAWLSFALRS